MRVDICANLWNCYNKDWGELQTKYFELMTLFCQFALRENGEEKHWYKKILELMPKDDSSSV